MSVLKHLQAILALPFMVIVVVPLLFIALSKVVVPFWEQPIPVNFLFAIAGLILTISGLVLLVSTIRLFMNKGRGTLAPWTPTQYLVILGPYRFVRNPMILGVICLLLSEAVYFGSPALFAWALTAIIVNVIYIPLLEEPGLIQRFGKDYKNYMQHVPRWIPQLHPWNSSNSH